MHQGVGRSTSSVVRPSADPKFRVQAPAEHFQIQWKFAPFSHRARIQVLLSWLCKWHCGISWELYEQLREAFVGCWLCATCLS
jgi:hypothetical protein